MLALRRAVFCRYVTPWDEARSEAELHRHLERGTVRLVESTGTPAGYVCAIGTPECLDLDELVVAPKRQRAGIGTAVVHALRQEAAARGLPLRLSVLRANPEAVRLYLRLGFALTKEEGPRMLLESRPAVPGQRP